MAERSSLNQAVQVGVESTAGTAVAANRKFETISIEPTPAFQIDQFRPAGQKFRALATLSKEWSTASISGRASYTEMVYLLSSLIDTATISTPGGATNARDWTFVSDSFDDDAPITLTVEHGSSFRADRFAYGIVNEFGMNFTRDTVEINGAMMGTAIEDGIALTPAPTTVGLQPILPDELSVYVDTTSAGLGTTKLLRVVSAEFSLSSRFNPVWVLDGAQNSFVAIVESEPDLTLSITMEADAAGMGILTPVRAGDTRFIRIKATSAVEIDAGLNNYEFELDFAGKVADTGGFSDADGLYAIEWSFVGVHDTTWGQAFQMRLRNGLTAL